MPTNYTVTISSLSSSTFCTIAYNGAGSDATYTDYNGNTGTLSKFSWTGSFTITTSAASGSFKSGTYRFAGGVSQGNGYQGTVITPSKKKQDPAKNWTASEG